VVVVVVEEEEEDDDDDEEEGAEILFPGSARGRGDHRGPEWCVWRRSADSAAPPPSQLPPAAPGAAPSVRPGAGAGGGSWSDAARRRASV